MAWKEVACKELWKEVFKDDEKFINHFLTSYYNDKNMYFIEQDNNLLSMIHLLPFRYKNKNIGLIYALATRANERNKGYATYLIQKAIEKGKEKGYEAIMLIPEKSNLHAFYERFGFRNSYRVTFELPDNFDFGIDDKANEWGKILPLTKKFIIPNNTHKIRLSWNGTTNNKTTIERHPWEPFLPSNAKILLLGSFPPQKKRWSMDFYYPNITNDFWKIIGHIFFNDEKHFILKEKKGFNLDGIKSFLHEKGIAMYDAATAVIRTKDNASDQYLEIVEATDMAALLKQIPHCRTIAVTGEKSAHTVLAPYNISTPLIGEYVDITFCNRTIRLYRMPSTSRAYPLALSKKAEYYKELFKTAGIE